MTNADYLKLCWDASEKANEAYKLILSARSMIDQVMQANLGEQSTVARGLLKQSQAVKQGLDGLVIGLDRLGDSFRD